MLLPSAHICPLAASIATRGTTFRIAVAIRSSGVDGQSGLQMQMKVIIGGASISRRNTESNTRAREPGDWRILLGHRNNDEDYLDPSSSSSTTSAARAFGRRVWQSKMSP